MTIQAPSTVARNATRDARLEQVAIEVIPVAGRIGAEIRGVRLAPDLDRQTIDQIRAAWLEYKVVFFRNQHHLNDASQEGLASIFGGAAVAHPTMPVAAGSNYILELNSKSGGRSNSWHTDLTFVDAYPRASILRALVIPETGGDTVWANLALAYQDLSPPLRALADKLWALHTNEHDYVAHRPDATAEAVKSHEEDLTWTVYETEHPLVHVHPETHERSLILGHFVRRILGVSGYDSAHLFQVFQDHITKLENTVRWRWAVGDVAVWDNRATQHYAINDYGDQHRVVRRVTVEGEVPVSIEGRRSVLRTRTLRIPR